MEKLVKVDQFLKQTHNPNCKFCKEIRRVAIREAYHVRPIECPPQTLEHHRHYGTEGLRKALNSALIMQRRHRPERAGTIWWPFREHACDHSTLMQGDFSFLSFPSQVKLAFKLIIFIISFCLWTPSGFLFVVSKKEYQHDHIMTSIWKKK